MLKFVIALVSDFERISTVIPTEIVNEQGVTEIIDIAKPMDVSDERHSIDGTNALKHIELLTADQLNLMRFDALFQFVGDAEIYDLMETPEWKAPDII